MDNDLEECIAGVELEHHAANAPYIARLRPTYIYQTHHQKIISFIQYGYCQLYL